MILVVPVLPDIFSLRFPFPLTGIPDVPLPLRVACIVFVSFKDLRICFDLCVREDVVVPSKWAASRVAVGASDLSKNEREKRGGGSGR